MNYFNIEPLTINVTPFETATANAITWKVNELPRGAQSARCMCSLVNTDNMNRTLYGWSLKIPYSILSQWLDDSVIDDYIIDSSNGRFVKDTTMVNRPLL
jgi:hypothetical protein